ncbi:MAG: alpha-glucosidase/alpha-galactosidase [Pseudomonadota bacterium]
MSFRIAVIGAGSVSFTQRLVSDVLCVPEFADCEIALTDINPQNLKMIEQIISAIIEANDLPTRVMATTDRRQALEGARYVISCVRIGGLEAFETDIEIPLKYGVDQCVGDTLCVGGILYGQRNIPAILDFCRDIKAEAEEGALFLNYANPMAMNTWAALETGGVDTVGLCHGVQHGAAQIEEVLGAEEGELDYICAGINHQTWFTELNLDGRAIGKEELLAAFEAHPVYSKQEKVRIDVLRRFGCYSTESNGHLSEYLPWYRKRPNEIADWVDMSNWIHGETGGYLRYTRERRNWFETDFPEFLEAAKRPLTDYKRSSEHASHILEALETGRVYRGHFNRRNGGSIANLPEDTIIEAPGFVDRFGINMVEGLELPMACAATCVSSINVQRMAVKAAIEGDLDLLRLAVLHDPLTGAICSPEEIWTMVDEMLVAQAQWLPQFADHIPAAKDRLAKSTVKTAPWEGAARRATRSLQEVRQAADLNKTG